METILKYDRVILTKELGEKLKKVGECYEIANINETGFLLRDAKKRVAIAKVSFEDFETHFVKEEERKGWTPWTAFTGFETQSDTFYKTNGKKVIVKMVKEGVKAESCCCHDDEFNLEFGIRLAYDRCLKKLLTRKLDEYHANYDSTLNLINDINSDIDVMIKSLGK